MTIRNYIVYIVLYFIVVYTYLHMVGVFACLHVYVCLHAHVHVLASKVSTHTYLQLCMYVYCVFACTHVATLYLYNMYSMFCSMLTLSSLIIDS